MGELIPVLMSIFWGIQCDLSSFAMLVIALFTDIPPSLSLMKEQPEIDLLTLPPRTRKDHLVDKKFILQAYGFMSILIVTSSQIIFFTYMKLYMNMNPSQIFFSFNNIVTNYNSSNWMYLKTIPGFNYTDLDTVSAYFNKQYFTAQTVTFTSLVMLQLFGNLLCTRTHVKSFFQQPPWHRQKRNLWIFAAEFCSVCMMLIVVYVPMFHEVFETGPVPAELIFMPLGFCVIIFTLEELRKLMVRKKVLCFHKVGW